jgi:TolB-like protein
MPQIFISHTPIDAPRAMKLAEELRMQNISVTTREESIVGGAVNGESIISEIEECTIFMLLLSKDSIASEAIRAEIWIARDRQKRILLVEIEPTALPSPYKEMLGKQEPVPIANFEAVRAAIAGNASHIMVRDNRNSLIVLPFEDRSDGEEDNLWFADGLAGEMIDALGHIKSLRILDRTSSKGLRDSALSVQEIAREFATRYFLEGSIQKSGEQIHIAIALLDTESERYLWKESYDTEFKEIFDIQEMVAAHVVEGLKLHLTTEEQSLLETRGTENSDAYAFVMRADEYTDLQTISGLMIAVQLYAEAIKLDPNYARAYGRKANALAGLYFRYDHDPLLLDQAIHLVDEVLRLKLDPTATYLPLTVIYRLQGKLTEAEHTALKWIQHAPNDSGGYFALGYFYYETEQYDKAIEPYEHAVRLRPDSLSTMWNLVLACDQAKSDVKRKYWAEEALELYERPRRARRSTGLAILKMEHRSTM